MRRIEKRIQFALRGGLVLILLSTAYACRGSDPTAPLDRDTFVEVMTDLRLAAREFTDPSAFDARKDEILRGAGVTDSALFAFVRVHERDPSFMASVWESIDERVNPPEPVDPETDTIAR